uniref:Acyl-CoA binding domain containing 4 n=1 Tax=Salmo trutta TaxID=8032 RepID=A0A674B738_SALTR
MPVPVMAESVDHQKRFQAAVDVIQNLPKSGAYRPPYEVMLRFYCLYKQAVCGPCTVSRPGFWDPVGRYKWDAWSRLGEMSSEIAMAAYVDEMKKVAQEVIDTMPINEKTASLFHHFEPLYMVIHDMPRPPDTLLDLRDGQTVLCVCVCVCLFIHTQVVPKSNGLHNGHAYSEPSSVQANHTETVCQATQVGAGQGGEGAGDGGGPPMRRSRDAGREGMRDHGWREQALGAGGGAGRGGGDGSEGGAERLQDIQVQQQILLALRRLREDMQSVMERLEAVERLAAAQALIYGFYMTGNTAMYLLVTDTLNKLKIKVGVWIRTSQYLV